MKILNETEYYVNSGGIDVVFALCIVVTILLVIAAMSSVISGEFLLALVLFVASSLTGLGAFQSGKVSLQKAAQYEVIITDFNEVHEKGYEIVEQRSEIFVVRKKEESK